MKTLLRFTLILALAMGFISCEEEETNQMNEPQTIAQIASADANFSTLVSALDRTGLTDVLNTAGNYTVFAPTNDAFQSLGVDLGTLTDDQLTEILLYHVLGAKVMAEDIATGKSYVSTAAATGPGNKALSLLIDNSGSVMLNNKATVTTANVEASNGVIHIIDEVILPLDIVGHASANSNFTQLVGALSNASLVEALQADGPYTVFAPVNSAFEAISTTVEGLSTEELANILKYHVVTPAHVRSTDLSDGMEVTALNEGMFVVNLGASVTITDGSDANATVVLTDVQATNGVIHVIDKVLLPE